jgi:hypothetical protein
LSIYLEGHLWGQDDSASASFGWKHRENVQLALGLSRNRTASLNLSDVTYFITRKLQKELIS